MFLHIGENISIYKDDIIAILDKKTVDKSADNNLLFKKVKNLNSDMDEDNIKTYILTLENGEISVYKSNISSITLLNRK